MTRASLEALSLWTNPARYSYHKEILSTIKNRPTSSKYFFDLHSRTGAARLQEVQDMGLIRPKDTKTQHSIYVLTYLGKRLMAHPDRDELLAELNDVRTEFERQRANRMRSIKKNHTKRLRKATRRILRASSNSTDKTHSS